MEQKTETFTDNGDSSVSIHAAEQQDAINKWEQDALNRGIVFKEAPDRELTFGEKLVGLTFNPSRDANVLRAKQLCAELADLIRPAVLHVDNTVEYFLTMHTIGEILNAQMNVVKLLTLKY